MYIENELSEIEHRMFDDSLLNKILFTYHKEMRNAKDSNSEQKYALGKVFLYALFDDAKNAEMDEMERLNTENARYLLQFGFEQGLYTGFEQMFSTNPTEKPFYTLVIKHIGHMPQMTKHLEYYTRKGNAEDIFLSLRKQLDRRSAFLLTGVFTAWTERYDMVLRHAFYLGYCYALSVIQNNISMKNNPQIAEKKAQLRQELGI